MQLALLVLILLIAVYVFTFPKYEISSIAISYFALFYVTVMLSCINRPVQYANVSLPHALKNTRTTIYAPSESIRIR